ncbi:hypothetical protein HMPREF9124_1897 [Oribacterium sp. oral taxon 108 str. F0425]|nr:hypothetical protein HMPREF9124_1897 [Oribacterium sp. oral taxon 108 str. F0425]
MKEENKAGRIKKTGERKSDKTHPEKYRKGRVRPIRRSMEKRKQF